ncbi:hypothetical protein [Enterovibrio nigricans]|uniref:Uncharacterized protein n=1 Tax=Enterovibrio nigricans DSM 22720 TaxID=1121868 RepID=A0A1T4UEZ2_9GAMM|nr:hypothetical protein [Enterovibrio nigricans]PKF51121.1 hypothetical protein AT251_06420 [Enterovibrio nigricans]SKA51254.1 hypothetical protein SAMN02745132_01586 [Enterovibrio nigricans DSM 22720]
MEEQKVKDLKTAIDGLIWLSTESVLQQPRRFLVDVSVWASRKTAKVEILDARTEAVIYLDSSNGKPFTAETILAMEDRLIEKLADLKKPQEQAA